MGRCAKCCVFLFSLVVAGRLPFTLGESTDDILRFLAVNEEKVVFDPKHKDVVLVFGNTGAGKTAFTQWIAGDDTKLISIEKDPGNFIIIDNDRIGNSTVQSKTTFPELVVDKETLTAFYDFSGFGDTRGIKNDIATSYFIKRIIDHVDKVKILLVTEYEAVRRGGNRKDFMKLLRHISELIRNTDRYTDSVGLVVTKIPNLYSRGKLVSDDAIVQGVSNFLDEILIDITERIELDNEFRLKMSNLIFNIISQNNAMADIDIRSYGEDSKIMLFRRPEDSGPLSSMFMFQTAKRRIRTIISENLKFVSKRNEDFRYTVSDDTKYKLYNIIDALKENLEENVKTVVLHLVKHYETKIDVIERNVKSIDIHDLEKAESELIKIQSLNKEVEDGLKTIFTLASEFQNIKRCKDIATVIKNTVGKVDLTIPPQIILNISSEVNFLEFIDEATILRFQFNTNLLNSFIQDTANKLNNSSRHAKQTIESFSISIEENIKNSYRKALQDLKKYISQTERTSFDLAEIKSNIYNFYSTLIKLQETSNPESKINKIINIFKMCNIIISEQVLQKFKDPKYYKVFTTELNPLVKSLSDSHIWYDFLDKLYNELSSYNVQNNKTVQNRCKSFIQSSAHYRGRNVRDTNIDFILPDCSTSLSITELNKIRNINLTQNNVDLLKNVVNFTLNDNILSYHCSNSKLVVKGRFVKISEVNFNFCNGISIIEIVGLEKIFFDKDIDFTGLNLNMIVIVPHWVILGDRKIILDGNPGELIWPRKAEEGQDGRPGLPGGNAGNFVGYGDKFTNSEKLFISANGGNGSPGQAGGDGKPGTDGAVPEIEHDTLEYGSLDSERHDNVEYWKSRSFTVYSSDRYLCAFPLIFCREYTVMGTSCTDGGDGGRGGVGGRGGAAGVVQAPYIEYSAKNGNDGAPGDHGRGGEAGDSSATVSVHETRVCYVLFKRKYYERTSIEYHRCSSGETPHGLYNSFGIVQRTSPDNFLVKKSPAIADFKSYLQQNLNKTLRQQYLLYILNEVHF